MPDSNTSQIGLARIGLAQIGFVESSGISGAASLVAAATIAASGSIVNAYTGTSSLTAAAATLAASGTIVNSYTGTSALTTTAATIAASGIVATSGTSALTVTAATVAAVGYFASGVPGLRLEIGGVDRTEWLATGTFSASIPLGGRATANAVVEDRGRGYTPVKNQTIMVFDGPVKRFAGIIWTVREKCHPGLNLAWTKQFTLRCLDYNYICDKRRATVEYEAGTMTLYEIVQDLVMNWAGGEGLTITNVATGPTILEKVSFNLDSLTECFNRLSTITGKYGDPYLWYVDFDKDIHFSQFSSNPAPFGLTETSNNFVDFELETSLDGYRNVQHARTEWQIAPNIKETFVGNSILIGFITKQQIVDTPIVWVNGVERTVGELGVDETGKDFYWIRDGFGIFNEDYATLTAADTLEVIYQPPATNVVTEYDYAEISSNGSFEAVDEQKNVNDYDTLVAVAKGGLTQFGTVATKAKFRTYTAGLLPGQRLDVHLTRHGVNTSYLIEAVNYRWRPAKSDFLEYDVQCTSLPKASPQRTAWLEKLVQMARIGSPAPEVAEAATPAPETPTTASLIFESVQLEYIQSFLGGCDVVAEGTDMSPHRPVLHHAAELLEISSDCKTAPSTDLVFQILRTADDGATWASVFDGDDFTHPAGVTGAVFTSAFSSVAASMPKGTKFRVDVSDAGGAEGWALKGRLRWIRATLVSDSISVTESITMVRNG